MGVAAFALFTKIYAVFSFVGRGIKVTVLKY